MAWHITDQTDNYHSYEQARQEFTWGIPSDYNIVCDTLRKHEDTSAPALLQQYDDRKTERYTFQNLDTQSKRIANVLAATGVSKGDRVAINAPQIPEMALTYLACWKLGAICVPISTLYGPDGISYRVRDSGASVLIVHPSREDTVRELKQELSTVKQIYHLSADGAPSEFERRIQEAASTTEITATTTKIPAILQYTSGMTGKPKVARTVVGIAEGRITIIGL